MRPGEKKEYVIKLETHIDGSMIGDPIDLSDVHYAFHHSELDRVARRPFNSSGGNSDEYIGRLIRRLRNRGLHGKADKIRMRVAELKKFVDPITGANKHAYGKIWYNFVVHASLTNS